MVYGMSLGATAADAEDEDGEGAGVGIRLVPVGKRVSRFKFLFIGKSLLVLTVRIKPFFTAEDVRAFRTLGLGPSTSFTHFLGPVPAIYWLTGSYLAIKLLGFKDQSELAFEDNIKHSFFIYPDEIVRSSLRPFSKAKTLAPYILMLYLIPLCVDKI